MSTVVEGLPDPIEIDLGQGTAGAPSPTLGVLTVQGETGTYPVSVVAGITGPVSVTFASPQPVTGTLGITGPISIATGLPIQGQGTAGAPTGGVLSVQGVINGVPQPVVGTVGVTGTHGITGYVGVTGSIAVSNFPSSYGITGGVGVTGSVGVTGAVSINNFPSAQGITGSVSIIGSVGITGPINIATGLPIQGQGTPGISTGGVLGVQGVTGGVPFPVIGTVGGVPLPINGTVGITGGIGITGNVGVTGVVNIGNFPASQGVTGSVSIIGPVTIISATGSVFQGQGTAGSPTGGVVSIQGVTNGTPVPVSGSIVAIPTGIQGITGSVSVTFPTSQGITGTVNVGNFPTSQGVTGTVSIIGSVGVTGTVSQSTGAAVQGQGTPGAPTGGVFSVQGVSGGLPLSVSISGGISTVPTGVQGITGFVSISGPVGITGVINQQTGAVVQGMGTPGIPTGGVITVQGASGAQSIPIVGPQPEGVTYTYNPVTVAGTDNTNIVRAISVDTFGNISIIGPGKAGQPTGGVLTVQGITGGLSIPVSIIGPIGITGTVTTSGGGGGGATGQPVQGQGTPGAPTGGVLTIQGATGATPILVSDATYYGTINQSITVTLASLANNAQRASASITNSINQFKNALVQLVVKTASSGVNNTGVVNIYAYGSVDGGSTYGDGVSGTDAGVTLTSPPNLKLIGQMNANVVSSVYRSNLCSVNAAFGGILPQFWGIVVENKTGNTLDATAGNFKSFYQGTH